MKSRYVIQFMIIISILYSFEASAQPSSYSRALRHHWKSAGASHQLDGVRKTSSDQHQSSEARQTWPDGDDRLLEEP